MTPEQKSAFERQGVLLLKGAVRGRDVDPLRDGVLDELKRLKVWSGGKALSAALKATPAFQQVAKLSGLVRLESLQARLVTPEIVSIIHALAAGIRLQPQPGQFLVSLPNQGAWGLAGLNWHTDLPATSAHRPLSGIQLFALIDDVQPHGGATLAIAGSHHLAREGRSQPLRELLRSQGDPTGELRGMDLSIVEMSGRAGDVYLMDMRVLHTPSINATSKVRMMATVRFLPAA